MKKKAAIIVLFFVFFQMISCKKQNKKENESIVETENVTNESSEKYVLQNAKHSINFIAYKTSEKKPVKGQFTKVEIINNCKGNSIKDAINGAEFNIPVSSIETNDDSRNMKIRKFFFGVMENTVNLSGKLNLNDDSNGTVDLKMNGITTKTPFTYTIEKDTFSLKTSINVTKWNATTALDSLNKACYDLHKGKDGISKTWDEVTIEIKSIF